MNRFAITLGCAVALAVWADAQHAPLASNHVQQYRENQALLKNLVQHTVELASTGDELGRAQACHRVMNDLNVAMSAAVTDNNPPRVAELGDHLAEVVKTALAPAISTAGTKLTAASPSLVTLNSLHTQATNELRLVALSVPAIGVLGSSPLVKEMSARLAEAAKALVDATPPPPAPLAPVPAGP
jgi:hypothetical protein